MSTRPMRRSTAGKQVLVIEDDSAIAEMIVMLLEGEGYQVTWADTAAAAIAVLCPYAGVADLEGPAILSLQAAMKARPDVILLDLLLPGMDGVEMVRLLSQTGQPLPPIIVISAKPHHTVELEADAIGAVSVIHKPFNIDVLLKSIDLVLVHAL